MREREVLGFSIGMGMMLVVLGTFGWIQANYVLDRVRYNFELTGIDATNHYLIADLNRLVWSYGWLTVIGISSLLLSGYIWRKEKAKATQA